MENFLKHFREEIDYIRPHEEEDDGWMFEGLNMIDNGQLESAEKKYKELILAQPDHHDGYEGMAYTYHEIGEHRKAEIFMEEAIRLASNFLEDDSIDPGIINDMQINLENIKNKKPLLKWWKK